MAVLFWSTPDQENEERRFAPPAAADYGIVGKKREAKMATIKSEAKRQAEFVAEAEAMYVRLRRWREMHPEASLDEIGEEVTRERQRLMGRLMGELATQPEEKVVGERHASNAERRCGERGSACEK